MSNIVQIKYLKRAKKVAFLLQLVPFVRAIFLTGSLAVKQATEESDIDFFIITKKGKIFSCRAFVTIFVSLTGYRRHGNKIAGRICLNCYQTEDNLTVKPFNARNARDYSKAAVLLDTNGCCRKFIKSNSWIEKKGFKFKEKKSEVKNSSLLSFIRKIGEVIFGWEFIERKLKNYQIKRILNDPRTIDSPKGAIFVSDNELRFHPANKRQGNS